MLPRKAAGTLQEFCMAMVKNLGRIWEIIIFMKRPQMVPSLLRLYEISFEVCQKPVFAIFFLKKGFVRSRAENKFPTPPVSPLQMIQRIVISKCTRSAVCFLTFDI